MYDYACYSTNHSVNGLQRLLAADDIVWNSLLANL